MDTKLKTNKKNKSNFSNLLSTFKDFFSTVDTNKDNEIFEEIKRIQSQLDTTYIETLEKQVNNHISIEKARKKHIQEKNIANKSANISRKANTKSKDEEEKAL